jgi:hypothetical protein
VSRSWAAAARSTASLWARISVFAADSSARACWVSPSSRAVSMAMAAWAASVPSSDTSSGANGRAVRLAANSTPITPGPRRIGTPRIATSPSSATPASISPEWRNRGSMA